jgi:hypothetical protein
VSTVVVVSPSAVPGLGLQTRRVAESFTGAAALARAVASHADWIWLLGNGARPRDDALERLLEFVEPPGEAAAAVVSGMVRDAAGRAVGHELPAGDERRLEDILRLAELGVLPIRNTTFANCLVERACFARAGLPDSNRYGPYAPVEWSARVLAAHPGYFVPSSIVVLDDPMGRVASLRSTTALARMVGTGAWTRGEGLAALRRVTRTAVRPGRPQRGHGAAR